MEILRLTASPTAWEVHLELTGRGQLHLCLSREDTTRAHLHQTLHGLWWGGSYQHPDCPWRVEDGYLVLLLSADSEEMELALLQAWSAGVAIPIWQRLLRLWEEDLPTTLSRTRSYRVDEILPEGDGWRYTLASPDGDYQSVIYQPSTALVEGLWTTLLLSETKSAPPRPSLWQLEGGPGTYAALWSAFWQITHHLQSQLRVSVLPQPSPHPLRVKADP